MKEKYLKIAETSFLALVLLLVGCAGLPPASRPSESPPSASSPASTAPSAASIPQPASESAVASAGETASPGALQNFKNWQENGGASASASDAAGVLLDDIVHETYGDDGTVSISMLYPRAWPSGPLGGSIPEYLGEGTMMELAVVYPEVSTQPSDVLAVTLSIANYAPEEFQQYVTGLADYGFVPVSPDEVSMPTYAAPVDDNTALFQNGDCICAVQDGGGALGVIAVAFQREVKTAPTEAPASSLIDFMQYAEKQGIDLPDHVSLDDVEEYDYDDGRVNKSTFIPSGWPLHVVGNLIPEYTYPAFIYDTEVAFPQGQSEEDALVVSILIGDFSFDDIGNYVDDLISHGFALLEKEYYTEHDQYISQDGSELYILTWPGYKCYVGPTVFNGSNCLLIGLRFEGRYHNFFV